MTKTHRRSKTKRRTRVALPAPRRTVTRREYAEVVVRLGAVETQLQRNRSTLEQQARRIAELKEQVDALKASAAAQTLAKDIPVLPLPVVPPTVES